jgi:predicted O-methyltransferase YrrM
MTTLASVYDLTLEPLKRFDFSRPLFVQASPAEEFRELFEVIHERLGLRFDRSAILTNAAYPARPEDGWTHLRNPDARLSADTAGLLRHALPEPPSIVVVTTIAQKLAMRFHSNVASFCHALEPTPSIVVTRVGQFAPARDFFNLADHEVAGTRFVANMLVSQDEAAALFRAAADRPAGHVVEVGRFSGGTAVLLALGARHGGRPGIVSVDQVRLPAVEHFCKVNGVQGDIQLLDGDSLAIAARWGGIQTQPGISMLFVDADHTYEGVIRDLDAWLPHVVAGGTIAMHDSTTPDCGVSKAIYRHALGRTEFGNFRQVGSTVFFERQG